MSDTPVTRALEALSIPFELRLHDRPVRSLEEAAAARGLAPGQIVRSLVFRIEEGTFVMVLMPGPEQISWPQLRHHLGVSRLTTASAEQVERETGYPPGAVSPFGLPRPMRLLADRSLLDLETISLGAGVPNAGVVLARADLFATLEIELGDFRAPKMSEENQLH